MALQPLLMKIPLGRRSYCSCIHLNDPYILSAVRTPIGRFQGKFASLTAVQLGTKALTGALERSSISKEDVSEFILGCTFQAGTGQNPSQQIALHSGLPFSIISSTVNKLCASGLKAVIVATQTILSQTHEVVATGGAESLTNVPYILRRKRMDTGNICMPDMLYHDGLNDMFDQTNVTHFAEETVKEYKMSRNDQDDYGIESYRRAIVARDNGIFRQEMVPVIMKQKNGDEEVVCEDEEIKRFDPDKFREVVPDIGKDGTITAANSSGFHDGAAMMILASGNYVLKKNLKPLARIVSFAEGSVDPKKFSLAPAVAVPRALVRANLTAENISMWEISETFAVTAMVNAKLLKIQPDKLNIHGGAISLGHPFGMTGARLVVHLAHSLKKGEFGCASVCHAGGGASAVIIEKM